MLLKDRTRTILEVAVRDFIKTGKPITSEYLYELHDFGIKPAMIRWELNELSEQGYFYQTHPSGGRFPTDKAYRFFVQEILGEARPDEAIKESPRAPVVDERDVKALVHEIAGDLRLLSVGYDIAARAMYGAGLKELLSHLTTETKDELVDVVRDFEMLEERLMKRREWWEDEAPWPKVFIGESPVTKSEHLSVIAGKFSCDGKEVLLFSIGPKRMDYEKSVGLFKKLGAPVAKKKKNSDTYGRTK